MLVECKFRVNHYSKVFFFKHMFELISVQGIRMGMFDVTEFAYRQYMTLTQVKLQQPIFWPFNKGFYVSLKWKGVFDGMDFLKDFSIVCK